MADQTVAKYGIFEQVFEASGGYGNPYVDLAVTAELTAPDGSTRSAMLFWDGGSQWRLRFSPDQVGTWAWRVAGADAGLAAQAGVFKAVDSSSRGGVTAMAGRPLHFQYQNGEPMWFVGDTAWALMTDHADKKHDRAAAEHYLSVRAAQGVNAVHAMLISEAGWGNRGGDAFDDLQAERLNAAYWQEVDERVACANALGMTVGLVLAWGDKGKNPNDWREFPSQEARLRYARYVAARYGAMNVYFIVAGEWNADLRRGVPEDQARADYNAIGAAVRAGDPHGRLVGMHPTEWGTSREFAQEPWCSFGDYQQMYSHLHAEILASRASQMPVVNAEYAYYLRDQDEDGVCDKQNSHDIDTIRHATWDIAMAGGYFITGWGNTYFGGNRHPGAFDVDAPENDDWEAQVQHVIAFFKGLYWWMLHPVDDLITAPVARDDDGVRAFEAGGRPRTHALPPATAYWALADANMMYVGYVRGTAGPVTLKLGDGVYLLRRFDPRSGAWLSLGETHGAWVLSPPDAQDWVFVAKRK